MKRTWTVWVHGPCALLTAAIKLSRFPQRKAATAVRAQFCTAYQRYVRLGTATAPGRVSIARIATETATVSALSVSVTTGTLVGRAKLRWAAVV